MRDVGLRSWEQDLAEVIAAVHARLPEPSTAADLERVLDELEAEQKQRHERELAALRRRRRLATVAYGLAGLAVGSIVAAVVVGVVR